VLVQLFRVASTTTLFLIVCGLGWAAQEKEPAKDQEPAAPKQEAEKDAQAPDQNKAVGKEAEKDDQAAAKPARPPLPGPPEIPNVALGPVLATTPIPRGVVPPNNTIVDASVLPRDKKGIWVLDFAFKPMRMATVDIPGKGRRQVHYLWYRVINRTGQPRMFVPQFTLVTDTKQRLEDTPGLPQAVRQISAREQATNINLLVNGPTSMGIIPASGKKEGIDDAVFGVAIWEGVDPKADSFSVFVRGLSDGFQLVKPPNASEKDTVQRDKTLRIDFSRPGDDRKLNEREIHLLDPPYEWIYW
jgi:hypothetical protein